MRRNENKSEKTIAFLLLIFLISNFAILNASGRSTAVCRYDLSDALNKDYVFCPTDQGLLPESTFCGNGIVDAGEECDDANTIDDDECKNDCTEGFFGDVLVVKINRLEKSDGSESSVFGTNDTMKYYISVKNKSSDLVVLTVPNPLKLVIFSKEELPGEILERKIPASGFVDIAPNSTLNFDGSFSWGTLIGSEPIQSGTYVVQVTVPVQETETNFYLNNSDSRFVTLSNAPQASVPETNILIMPLLIIIVISILIKKRKV